MQPAHFNHNQYGFAPLLLVVGLAVMIVVVGVGAMVGIKLTEKPALSPQPTPIVEENVPIICPQDAQLCPDGTYVRRIAPDCAFAVCEGSRAAYLKDQDIFASKEFVKRNFSAEDTQPMDAKMPTFVTSQAEDTLVGMRCSYELNCVNPYNECGYTTTNTQKKTTDSALMDIIQNANGSINKYDIDGDVSNVIYCEMDTGQRLLRYQAETPNKDRQIDFLGLVLSNNSVRVLGQQINYGTYRYGCKSLVQIDKAGELYYFCGGGDKDTSILELYKLNINNSEKNTVYQCKKKKDLETQEPVIECS